MKKLTALLLIGLLFLAGCQKTPEKEVVVQKDLEQMLDTASSNNDSGENSDKSLTEQYGIPTEYQWEAQRQNGKLNIKVDKQHVFVPEGNKMPIYRVKATDFTQEQVTAFWNELVGDSEMWNYMPAQTKEQIQDYILWIKEQMADEEKLKDSFGTPEAAQEEIELLEHEYQTAPETDGETRADDILNEMFVYENAAEQSGKRLASYTGIRTYEKAHNEAGRGKQFEVINNNDLKEGIVIPETEQGTPSHTLNASSSASMFYVDNNNPGMTVGYDSVSAMPVTAETILEPSLMERTSLSPKEAIEQVQVLLDESGSGMTVYRAYLHINETTQDVDSNGMPIMRPAEQCAYMIECVRAVDGIPVSCVSGSSVAEGSNTSEANMAPRWVYENMSFTMNKDGIYEMSWSSPLEIIETVNEDAQLKPFSEIQEIFETMMLVKYEPFAEGNMNDTYEIDRVELSLHRIAEQNSYENGLLVPVWNFYGKETVKVDEQTTNVPSAVSNSLMVINAIDGTVIDIEKGY